MLVERTNQEGTPLKMPRAALTREVLRTIESFYFLWNFCLLRVFVKIGKEESTLTGDKTNRLDTDSAE